MSHFVRKAFLYITIILFLLIAPTIIAYALGYSFDWQTKKPVLTGGFYLKSVPKKTNIYINDKFEQETPAFIKRLVPKYYQIRIEKEGYYPWGKNLKVESKIVTEVKNIILIPKEPELKEENIFPLIEEPLHTFRLENNILYKEDEQISLTPLEDGEYEIFARNDNVILLSKDLYLLNQRTFETIAKDVSFAQFSENNRLLYLTNNEIWVYDFNDQTKELITRSSREIKQAAWYLNEHIVFTTEEAAKIIEIDSRDKRNIFNLVEMEVDRIICNEKIYFKAQDKIFSLLLE